MHVAGHHGLGYLLHGGQIVEDPEAAALGRRDQVVVAEGEVGDGDDGQVELPLLPAVPGVAREEDAHLGAGVQETR